MNTPIMEIDNILVVPVQSSLSDAAALKMQKDLASIISKRSIQGIVIDLTDVDLVDSFIARVLVDIGGMTRLMGAITVATGIQPAVAITLVEMGLTVEGVLTALDLQQGINKLRLLKKEG